MHDDLSIMTSHLDSKILKFKKGTQVRMQETFNLGITRVYVSFVPRNKDWGANLIGNSTTFPLDHSPWLNSNSSFVGLFS